LVMNIKDSEAAQYAIYPIFTHLWVYGCWLRESLVGVTQMMPSVISDTTFIIDTTVSPKYRNLGIATELISQRERFLVSLNRTKVVSTIAPWNGSSLNCNLNKHNARGIKYHLGDKNLGEDKIETRKNLLSTKVLGAKTDSTKVFNIHSRRRYLASQQRIDIEGLMNTDGYQLARVRALDEGKSDSCVLFFELQREGE